MATLGLMPSLLSLSIKGDKVSECDKSLMGEESKFYGLDVWCQMLVEAWRKGTVIEDPVDKAGFWKVVGIRNELIGLIKALIGGKQKTKQRGKIVY